MTVFLYQNHSIYFPPTLMVNDVKIYDHHKAWVSSQRMFNYFHIICATIVTAYLAIHRVCACADSYFSPVVVCELRSDTMSTSQC